MATLRFIGLLCLCVCCNAGFFDRIQDQKDTSFPLLSGYFRIESAILKLDNPGAISHTNTPCDITDKCDPTVTAIIDTEKPNHDFGGDSAPYRNWEKLYDGREINSPEINKVLTRDNCGKAIRKVNVRVRAMDKDTVNDDKIDNFSCFITGSGPIGMPAPNKEEAKWSPDLTCDGLDQKAIKVHFRYRWYNIPQADCKAIKTSGIPFIDGMFS